VSGPERKEMNAEGVCDKHLLFRIPGLALRNTAPRGHRRGRHTAIAAFPQEEQSPSHLQEPSSQAGLADELKVGAVPQVATTSGSVLPARLTNTAGREVATPESVT
jgi:hypothetical protein